MGAEGNVGLFFVFFFFFNTGQIDVRVWVVDAGCGEGTFRITAQAKGMTLTVRHDE